MADYNDVDGVKGQVENEKYCMKDSWQARNVNEMNKGMGYENMADLANTPHAPTKMTGDKENRQMSPSMPGENRFNYDKNR